MRCQVFAFHPPQQHQERHVAQRKARLGSCKDELVADLNGNVDGLHPLKDRASARSLNGTRCSLPAFIRSAGTVQTLADRSISLQRAPMTSPVRAAVRMANSSARAAKPSCSRKSVKKCRYEQHRAGLRDV